MATVKSAIYGLLATEAQDNTAGMLGALIGLSGTEPYGVFFRNPPKGTNFGSNSIITFFINSMGGRFPRSVWVNVTAWGTNYEEILERVNALLDDAQLTGLTDYAPLMLKWDGGGPELFDDDLQVYYQQYRYEFKGVKL